MTHVCPCIVFTYYYSLCISTFFHPHIVHFPVIRLNFAPQCGQICVLATLLITESPLLFTFCFFISFPLLLSQQIANAFNYFLLTTLCCFYQTICCFYFTTVRMVFAIPIQTHFIRLIFPYKFFNRINHSIEHIYTLIKIYHTYKNLTIISQSKYNNKLE